jgi:hypothetical protein
MGAAHGEQEGCDAPDYRFGRMTLVSPNHTFPVARKLCAKIRNEESDTTRRLAGAILADEVHDALVRAIVAPSSKSGGTVAHGPRLSSRDVMLSSDGYASGPTPWAAVQQATWVAVKRTA